MATADFSMAVYGFNQNAAIVILMEKLSRKQTNT